MSATQEQLGRGRPVPQGPRRGRRALPVAPDVRLRPVVAAAVVLLLWFAWLLVPTSSDEPGGAAPAAPVAGEADPGGIEAQLFGDGSAAADGRGPVAPSAAATGPAQAPPDPGPAPTAAAPTAEPAPSLQPAPSVQPATAEPAPVEPEPVVVPQSGEGTFAVAPGGSDRVGEQGTLVTYSVEVEDGLPIDVAEVAQVVDGVLADPRSWTARGEWSLQRTDADPDVRLRVSTPDTTDRLCAPLRTNGQVSCRNGDDVVLNALRWTQGAGPWGDEIVGYREYLVNHELGHYLGQGHTPCPAEGELAPVMLQQTLGLQGCLANGWPYP